MFHIYSNNGNTLFHQRKQCVSLIDTMCFHYWNNNETLSLIP